MSLTQDQKGKADAMVLKTVLQEARNKSLRHFSVECDASISRALSSINDLLEYLKEAKPMDGVTQKGIDECVSMLQDEQYKTKTALIKCIKEKVGVVLMYNRDTKDLQWSTNLESLHGYDHFMIEDEFNYININLARFDCSGSYDITPIIIKLRESYKERTDFLFNALKKIAESS